MSPSFRPVNGPVEIIYPRFISLNPDLLVRYPRCAGEERHSTLSDCTVKHPLFIVFFFFFKRAQEKKNKNPLSLWQFTMSPILN